MLLGEEGCRTGMRMGGGRRWLKGELVSNGSRGERIKETTDLISPAAAAIMEGSLSLDSCDQSPMPNWSILTISV